VEEANILNNFSYWNRKLDLIYIILEFEQRALWFLRL